MIALVQNFQLDQQTVDKLVWKWDNKGAFTVNSFYRWLDFGGTK